MYEVKDTLGTTIKNARSALELTQEQLAERLNISSRYLMQLESSRKKPSYDLLFRIIRELHIQPDLIFYPENLSESSCADDLVRMLHNCDDRSMKVIHATARALSDN